jgi:hypothetical protein
MPNSGGCDFLFWLNEYWGRRRHSMSTTWKDSKRMGRKLWHCNCEVDKRLQDKSWWRLRVVCWWVWWRARGSSLSFFSWVFSGYWWKLAVCRWFQVSVLWRIIENLHQSPMKPPPSPLKSLGLMTIIRYEKINWTMCEFDAKFIQILKKFSQSSKKYLPVFFKIMSHIKPIQKIYVPNNDHSIALG